MSHSRSSSPTGPQSLRASMEKSDAAHLEVDTKESLQIGQTSPPNGLQRKLTNRKVQLVAIGGSIGTALFISIGGALNKSGPGSLFLGFVIYNIFLAMMNNCLAEMTIYMPVSAGFIRMAGHWVDEALGFCVGWNFFLFLAILIPFEITALSFVLSFWSDNIPVAAICGACIAVYFCLNVYTVAVYGEAEFWFSSGKKLLMFMLFFMTIVTMCGGNPQHDAYGFRHWKGSNAFVEFFSTGALGRFEGFLAALWFATFTCVGPEFVGMMAAEAKHPRVYVKTAFKIVYWRLLVFFIGGALAVGILVAYNDPILNAIYQAGNGHSGSAAASPYIIAIQNMGIPILPHIVTALIATTIFSAGNTYVYAATRSLYGLAIEGRAPKLLTKCTKKGVPIYCSALVMLFPFLSFLQLSNNTAIVLNWLINLATGAIVVDFIVICITYIRFHKACVAQGMDRSKLPYFGRFQPWSAYIALVWEILIAFFCGHRSLSPFDPSVFVTAYAMPILAIVLFTTWKFIKKTKWIKPKDVDLVWEAPQVTAYETTCDEPPVGFWRDVFLFFRGMVQKPKVSTV
ncbi:amino acid permease AGP2 [Paramyrothecium foliicola]|nr:amino acid permease AGP2 [Paramyrothecium foliicola]